MSGFRNQSPTIKDVIRNRARRSSQNPRLVKCTCIREFRRSAACSVGCFVGRPFGRHLLTSQLPQLLDKQGYNSPSRVESCQGRRGNCPWRSPLRAVFYVLPRSAAGNRSRSLTGQPGSEPTNQPTKPTETHNLSSKHAEDFYGFKLKAADEKSLSIYLST